MDYGQLSRDLVADAFQNKIPGLKKDVVIHYLTGQGDYDPETGTYPNTTVDSPAIPVVTARPTLKEIDDLGVVCTDVKLVVPGKLVTQEIDDNSTVTMDSRVWTVVKAVGVPGGAVVLVFARAT